ncbi:uracil-DNA glycosylase, partial [Bartonella bacilliformis]
MSQQTQCPISYEELLSFYKESGADAALADEPIN